MSYDFSAIDLSPVTDTLGDIMISVMPILIVVLAATIGVKLFKKFAKGVG